MNEPELSITEQLAEVKERAAANARDRESLKPDAQEVPVPETAELLEKVMHCLNRFVIFPSKHQVVAIALWVLHTHIYESFDTTPYLAINSPTKQAGKTRLFEVLAALVARAWTAIEATEAVLFRKISANRPTLLLDEIDAAFGKDSTLTEGIRAILNAGYRRGAAVPRCVGPAFDLKDFDVYCPKAFAGIGDKLPDTIADRSIPIELRRRGPGERKPDRLRRVTIENELRPIGRLIEEWATAVVSRMGDETPDLPDELSDRQQDAWEPLLAIADDAGGEWPQIARESAIALHGGVTDQDAGVLLLKHIREVFADQSSDKIATEGILLALVNRGDDSPWARWWGEDVERGQTKGPGSQLARKLKPYGIHPEQIWLENTKTRGYKEAHFEDAWNRYIPAESPSTLSLRDANGRTVDSRSEAISTPKASMAKSGLEQDSTVLPSFPREEDGRSLSERDSPISEQQWIALSEQIGSLPEGSLISEQIAVILDAVRARTGETESLFGEDFTETEIAEMRRLVSLYP